MKLSIVIPTFNEEDYLPKLLRSIRMQDFGDYEVIVADAMSDDKTREIAKSYGCKIVDGGSISVGRNRGAEAAKGDFLLFLDADVVLTEGYLKSAMQEFTDNDLGIAISLIKPLSDKKFDKLSHDIANLFAKSVETIKPHGGGCQGILTRKSLHEEVGGFDEDLDFGEDTDYIERIGYISSFKVLRDACLLISIRRLEKEGRRNLAFKYTKSTLYQFAGRKISARELGYTFGHNQSNRKRIIYSVCGEGMGHATRSGVVIEHLLEKNEVTVFAHGRAYDYLSEKFDGVYQIEGFNTVYEDNRVNDTKTFISNIKDLPQDLKNNLRLMYSVAKSFKPDLIISDFEFYSNLLSKILRIPLISLDNMHVMTQCEIQVPRKYRNDRIKAESVVRSFIQLPRYYLITSYFYPTPKNPGKVKMYPPILRKDILNLKPDEGEHVLVYQTSDSNLKLIELLKEMDDEFIIYGFHKDEVDGNLCFKKFNDDEFFQDLASSRAVITNGGFTLISEALYLQKPIFSIPVKKQFEQILNAIYLEKLGYGEFYQEPDREDIEEFLSKLGEYRQNIKNNFKHDQNQTILHDLDRIIEECS